MRVVLPASGWLMMAKVRRRAASSDGVGIGPSMCFAGADGRPHAGGARRLRRARLRAAAGLRRRRHLPGDARRRHRRHPRPGQRHAGARGAGAARGEPRRARRVTRGAGLEGVQAPPARRVRGVRPPRRRARPGRRPRRPAARLLPLAVHLQEPGRVGPALAPGQLVLPVRAGPADHRRVARRHAGHPRERVPARAARVAPRAGARARARPAPRRQLRLRRDRRPRHDAGRSRCSWTRATCCSSTAT